MGTGEARRLLKVELMASGIWSAASGATARIHSLDVSTSNLVNASTAGYRSDKAVFRTALAKAERGSPPPSVVYRTSAPDMSVGQLISTGQKLDVAIPDEDGLFVVSTPDGPRYTRAGSFKLGPDGSLLSADGAPIMATDNRPVRVAPGAQDVSLDRTGTLVVDGERQQQLAVVKFPNPSGLEKVGSVLMRARPEAGKPVAHEGALEPGMLELSNEDAVSGMADEVRNVREFEMTMRVIEAFREIERSSATKIIGV